MAYDPNIVRRASARLEENRREKSRERYFEGLRKDAVLRYFFGK